MAGNFNGSFANEGLLNVLKITANHVHCKCCNISEMVQVGVRPDHYQEVTFRLSNSGSSDDIE